MKNSLFQEHFTFVGNISYTASRFNFVTLLFKLLFMNTFLSNWHFMRLFRLALAVFSAWQAVETNQWVFWVFAGFFLLQVLFNFGCGPKGCSVPNSKNK